MDIASLLILLLFLGAMYFLLIRPQRKRQKEHEEMVSALAVGDDVVTIGGMHGTVIALDEDTVDLEVTEEIALRFQKSAIARTVEHTGGQE